MHVTGDISLGAISVIVTLLGIAIAFGMRVGRVEATLMTHAQHLVSHGLRLDGYEARLIDVVGHVQRIVGRIETVQTRMERSAGRGGDES